jgi:hypothetical protein
VTGPVLSVPGQTGPMSDRVIDSGSSGRGVRVRQLYSAARHRAVDIRRASH